MTIAETHRVMLSIIKKERNEFVSHQNLDDMLHMAQMAYMADLIGNFRQYQPGRPVPPNVNGITQRNRDELSPFRLNITFLDTDFSALDPYGILPDGILNLPSDYLYMDGLYSIVSDNGTTRERPIDILTIDEWAYRVDSAIVPPTKIDPIALMEGESKIRFLPKNISGKLYYYKKPPRPNYVFTVDATRIETHDAVTSTNLLWSEVGAYTVIRKALSTIGIIIEDNLVLQKMAQEEAVNQ